MLVRISEQKRIITDKYQAQRLTIMKGWWLLVNQWKKKKKKKKEEEEEGEEEGKKKKKKKKKGRVGKMSSAE